MNHSFQYLQAQSRHSIPLCIQVFGRVSQDFYRAELHSKRIGRFTVIDALASIDVYFQKLWHTKVSTMAGVYMPPVRLSVMPLTFSRAGDDGIIRMDTEQEQAVATRPT
jgi:hypothetical protein